MVSAGFGYEGFIVFDKVADITPDDSNDLTEPGVVYIGTGGDVKVTGANGGTVTFVDAASGVVLPCKVNRVWSTGTTASDLVLGYS